MKSYEVTYMKGLQLRIKVLEKLVGDAFDAGANRQASLMTGLHTVIPQHSKEEFLRIYGIGVDDAKA